MHTQLADEKRGQAACFAVDVTDTGSKTINHQPAAQRK